MNITAKKLARSAVIAALYAVCTILFSPISYGPVQFRIAECLCVLAFFYAEGVVGLTIGCLIANFLGNGPLDIVLGTFATFLASVLSFYTARKIKKDLLRFFVCAIYPIVINAIIVPFTFLLITEMESLYFISALQVGVGQTVVILSLGLFVYMALLKIQKRRGGRL